MLQVDRQSVGSGTVYLLVANAIMALSGYLSHLIVGRTLGPADYGIYVVIINLLMIIDLLLSSGVPVTASKRMSEEPSNAQSVSNSTILVQGITSVLLFFAYFLSADFIASLLNDPSLSTYIRLSSVTIPIYGMYSVLDGHLNGLRRYKEQAISSILYSIAKVTIISSVVLLGFSVYGAVFGFAISPILGLLACIYFRNVFKWDKTVGAREILTFSAPLMLGSTVFISIMTIDVFLVKALVGSGSLVGFYAAASTIASVLLVISQAITRAVFPVVSHSAFRSDKLVAERYVSTGMRYCIMILLPLAVIVSASSISLIKFFFSEEYINSAPILALLSPALMFLALFYYTTNMITAFGKPNITFGLSALTLILNALLGYASIKHLGVIGAPAAALTACLFGLLVSMWYMRKNLNLRLPGLSLSRITIAGLVVYSLCLLTPAEGLHALILDLCLLIIYVAVLIAIKEIDERDFSLLRRTIKQLGL